MANYFNLVSACPGMIWPAIPSRENTLLAALLFQFEQTQWWPADVLRHHQFRQLESLAAHAYKSAPFYRQRLDFIAGIKPGALSLKTWRQIPLLQRSDLQDSYQDIISQNIPEAYQPTVETSTSGSTGSPVTVQTTNIGRLFDDAINTRYHLWHKKDFTGKLCVIQPMLSRAKHAKPQTWAAGYETGPIVRLDIAIPIDEQFNWLVDQAPDYLMTYPSNLQALLDYGAEHGHKIPSLRGVSTLSEVLEPETRAECTKVFGVAVTDVYSAKEVGLIALQCPEHAVHHVQLESQFVEVLRDDGSPCEPGETGRVVVTDLTNFATPLIRYDIRDYAELGAPCACGRGLPVLSRILGRTRNMVHLPSGQKYWPLIGLTRVQKFPFIRQAQVVQETFSSLRVNLIVSRTVTAAEEKNLIAHFQNAFGHPFDVHLNYVEDIPRSTGGKFENFRCEVSS